PPYILNAYPLEMISLTAFQPGEYSFTTSNSREFKIDVPPLQAAAEIPGPWTLRFPPNWGAPPSIQLDKLISWSEHSDPGVRYFPGTAEYEKEVDIPPALLAAGQALYLDLGQVAVVAEVMLNGTPLGTWWKPPYFGEITAAAKPGPNTLKIRVTNLWVNR